MRNGKDGALTPAPELHSFKTRLKKGFFIRGSSPCGWVKVARNHRLPCRVLPLRRLPALSLLPGQTVAHDAK